MGCGQSWAHERDCELQEIAENYGLVKFNLSNVCLDIAKEVHNETKLIGKDLAVLLQYRVKQIIKNRRINEIKRDITRLESELQTLLNESD